MGVVFFIRGARRSRHHLSITVMTDTTTYEDLIFCPRIFSQCKLGEKSSRLWRLSVPACFPDARRETELSSQFLHGDCAFSESLDFLYRFSGEELSLLKSLRGMKTFRRSSFPRNEHGQARVQILCSGEGRLFFTASFSRL